MELNVKEVKKRKLILTVIIISFLLASLIGNSFFQFGFFSGRWKLDAAWIVLLLSIENGSKVIIEIISITLYKVLKGIMRYVATLIVWLFLFGLVSFGIFQTFGTRTYLTQLESREDKTKNNERRMKSLRTRKERLENSISRMMKKEEINSKLEAKRLEIISKAVDKTENEWNIRKFSQTLIPEQKKLLLSRQANKLSMEKEIADIDKQLTNVEEDNLFNYKIAIDNALYGKINKWDIIADLGISIVLEGLIFVLSLGVSVIWKDEISESILILEQHRESEAAFLRWIGAKDDGKGQTPVMKGNRLKSIRTKTNSVSRLGFAHLLGISQEALARYESGEDEIPIGIIRKLKELKEEGRIK